MALTISNGPFTGKVENAGSVANPQTYVTTGITAAAGSIVLLHFGWSSNFNVDPLTFVVTDNSGQTTTWSAPVALQKTIVNGNAYNNQSMFFWTYTAAGFSGATVTVTSTPGSSITGIWAYSTIVAVTGANTSSPIGGTGIGGNGGSATASVSLTSTGTQSLVLMGINDWSGLALGAVDGASTSLSTNGTAGSTSVVSLQRLTSLVNAGAQSASRTLGGSDWWTASAIELLSGTGATPFVPNIYPDRLAALSQPINNISNYSNPGSIWPSPGQADYSIIDFGPYGSNETFSDVLAPTIISTSKAEAWMMAEPYLDKTLNDQAYVAKFCKLICGNVIAGKGFTIYARSTEKLVGKFKIRWVWL